MSETLKNTLKILINPLRSSNSHISLEYDLCEKKKSNIHCHKNTAKAMRTANFFLLLKGLKYMFYLLMSDSQKYNAVIKQHKGQVYF